MTPMFELARTVHALHHVATVICDAEDYADSMGDITELKHGMDMYELQVK
jgi:hypothetical protein